MTHVRMAQIERGLRVSGGEVNAHYDRAGRLSSIQQRIVPNLEKLDLTPTIDAQQAAELALATKPKHALKGEPELIVRGTKEPVLAWQLTVAWGLTSSWQIEVDAKSRAPASGSKEAWPSPPTNSIAISVSNMERCAT